jgi:hypothetical protein
VRLIQSQLRIVTATGYAFVVFVPLIRWNFMTKRHKAHTIYKRKHIPASEWNLRSNLEILTSCIISRKQLTIGRHIVDIHFLKFMMLICQPKVTIDVAPCFDSRVNRISGWPHFT